MTARVSRRALLVATLAGAAAAAALPLLREGTFEYGLGLLRRQFGARVGDDPLATRFMRDYVRLKVEPRRPEGPLVEAFLDLGLDRAGFLAGRLRVLDDDIVQNFVLSTNVLEVVGKAATLSYGGFHDPYERPCANPLGVHGRGDA